jgi:hypothetical protein
MTWAALETVLGGHLDASGALDALTTSSMQDVQAMLDGIDAGEAGRLLAEALTAEPQTRLAKLAAGLEIIDQRLPTGQVRRAAVFGWRRGWVGETSNGDSIRAALLASLIDAVLGGDPEGLRTRAVAATAGWEGAIVPELKGLSKRDVQAEIMAGRRVLRIVFQLLLHEIQTRSGDAVNG